MATDLERKDLYAALSWLDARLEREVLAWQAAGQDPADRFRGLRISAEESLALARQAPGSSWGADIDLPEEETTALQDKVTAAQATLDQLDGQPGMRLIALRDIFHLDAFEWWTLVICLAPALDLRYERIYGYLQDDVTRTHASADLVLRLLLPEDLGRLDCLRYFDPDATLRQFRLILPLESAGVIHPLRQMYQAAPALAAWLLDGYNTSWLSEQARLFLRTDEEDPFVFENLPAPDVFRRVQPLVSISGNDLLQQEWAVEQYAAALSQPMLRIKLRSDASAADKGQNAEDESRPAVAHLQSALDLIHQAVRDARLLNAVLYIQHADVLADRDGRLLPSAFAALRLREGGVLLSSPKALRLDDAMRGSDYPMMHVTFQPLSTSERAELWDAMLGGLAEDLPADGMESLAGQFLLSSGQIVAAASTAMSQALLENRSLTVRDLYQAACFHSGHQLEEMAQKIEPRFTWADLVLPETPLNMLHEMVNMIKSRRKVMEEWGLGKKLTASGGVAALFTGPPGTGKTLAAQIIASELGIDLYRIDLSTIVSKYVGETEKNLERIFREAQTSNAILFFDEADSIFGKRSEVKDAQDRYANIEVGYLLQRMEAYTGIAILATNLRANLDEAFTRRLQFIVTFPFPDEADRLRLWQVLIPPGLPRDPDLDLKLMASRFKLAGGNIRNIIVSAAYLAAENGGRVCMSHLIHGARREFQKMGKLLHEADFVLTPGQNGGKQI